MGYYSFSGDYLEEYEVSLTFTKANTTVVVAEITESTSHSVAIATAVMAHSVYFRDWKIIEVEAVRKHDA